MELVFPGRSLEIWMYTDMWLLRMRLAALKPFGDPKVSADWSVWNAPEISILGKFGPSPYNLDEQV
jgi:hypothetical protein